MKQCVIQHKSFTTEEMRMSPVSDIRSTVVCPKPRRVGRLFSSSAVGDCHVKPLRWLCTQQAEVVEAKSGSDLLDTILSKDVCEDDDENSSSTEVGSGHPFFSGSPPSRVANPLIHDSKFGDDETFLPLSPQSPTRQNGGCVRASFGNNPAVRIEGFDCLDRDNTRNCSIPALA